LQIYTAIWYLQTFFLFFNCLFIQINRSQLFRYVDSIKASDL
jgi:hypothetical protein